MTPEQLAVRLDHICSFIDIGVDALHGRNDVESRLAVKALTLAKSEVSYLKDEAILTSATNKTKPASVKVPTHPKPRKPRKGKKS